MDRRDFNTHRSKKKDFHFSTWYCLLTHDTGTPSSASYYQARRDLTEAPTRVPGHTDDGRSSFIIPRLGGKQYWDGYTYVILIRWIDLAQAAKRDFSGLFLPLQCINAHVVSISPLKLKRSSETWTLKDAVVHWQSGSNPIKGPVHKAWATPPVLH